MGGARRSRPQGRYRRPRWQDIAAALVLSLPTLLAAQEARPNILIILVDDLRHDALSVVGNPNYAFSQTPNIDGIALEGARFEDSFVVHSLCSPSRATVITA